MSGSDPELDRKTMIELLSRLEHGLNFITQSIHTWSDEQARLRTDISVWRERLEDNQKAILGHLKMGNSDAERMSHNIEALNQQYFEQRRRVLDLEERYHPNEPTDE